MNSSVDSYLSINEILADVLRITNDEDMRTMNIGWYKRQVKIALDELNYRTHFDIRYMDYDIPENNQIKIDKGMWNMIDIYVYNGDCFNINTSHRVHHKDNFIKGSGSGYTARVKTDQYDYYNRGFGDDASMLFYNVQNGVIYLSDFISNYEKIRIVYNGTASTSDDVKIIPPFIREAVIGYVCVQFFKTQMVKSPNASSHYKTFHNDLYGQKSRCELCTWDEAKYMLNRMDSKQRADKNEAWGRLNA